MNQGRRSDGMRRHSALAAGAAVVVAITTACSSGGSGSNSPAASGTAGSVATGGGGSNQPISFSVGVVQGIPIAAVYAMPRYAASNVEIKQVTTASGPIGISGLLSGQIQIDPVGYSTYIQSLAKGDKLTAVAGVANGGLEIVANPKIVPSNEINTDQAVYTGSAPWSILAGKRIATIPGSYPDMACRQYLDSHGVDISKTNFVTAASFAQEMTLVENGSVDAACGLDPYPLISRSDKKVVLLDFPYPSLDSYLAFSTVLAVSTDEVKKHPEVVQAAVNALVKSTDAMNQGADKANLLDSLATYLPFPRNILALGVSDSATAGKDPKYWFNTVFSNEMKNKSTADLVPLELKLGLIKGDESSLKKTVTDSFDYSFLEKATGKTAEQLGSGQ